MKEAPRIPSDRPIWFDAFVVTVAVFLVYAATATYHDPLNNDPQSTAVAAWQLAIHGNATLTALHGHVGWIYSVGGREVTNRLPGTIFWGAPFYAGLGRGASPTVYPSAIAASAASAIAIGLTFAICTRIASRRTALLAALLLAFATGTWTVSSDQLWTHGPAQVAILVTLALSINRHWLLAGIPAGFAILIRPHLGIVAVMLGVLAAVHERRLRPLLISVGSAVGLGILLVYNHDVWRTWSVFGGYPEPAPASGHVLRDFGEGIVGAFISPERGILIMTPALLMLIPGLRLAWRIAPWWVRSASIAGVCYLAEQLWVSRFSGGNGFYSYRTTLESLTLTVPLLVLAWQQLATSRVRRTAFVALATASVALHAFGAVVNWVPGGVSHSPWTTYLPTDLAYHIGARQTAGWVGGALIAIAASAVIAWRRTPTSSDRMSTDRPTRAMRTEPVT